MDESTEARLARLAERRRASEPTSAGRRRRHAAEASRVLAAGISASAFMGTITGIALSSSSNASATPRIEPAPMTTTSKPRTVVRVRKVARIVYVDQNGRPIGTQVVAPSGSSPAPAAGSMRSPDLVVTNTSSAAGPANAVVAPSPNPAFAPAPSPAPTPASSTRAGAPAMPTYPTAAPSTPPAPVATSPPATVAPPATTPPPPPPTTLPKCTGSKCP
jgi:hypothetical protein